MFEIYTHYLNCILYIKFAYMKKILYWLIGLGIALFLWIGIYISLRILGYQERVFTVDDGIRHEAFAQILYTHGIEQWYEKYGWGDLLPNTILATYDTDLRKGFHMLLLGMKYIWIDWLDALKAFCAFMVALFFLVIWGISKDRKLPIIVALICFTIVIVDKWVVTRLLLARPYIFSVLLYGIFIYFLHTRRFMASGIILLIVTYFHAIFWVFALPVGLYTLCNIKQRRDWLQLVWISLVWVGAWLLLHGQPVTYIELSFIQIAVVPFLHRMYQVFASELTMSIQPMLTNSIFLATCAMFLYGFFWEIYKRGNKTLEKNKHLLFMFVHSFFLAFISGFIGRFVDFFLISLLISLLLMISVIRHDGWFDALYKNYTKKIQYIFIFVLIFFGPIWMRIFYKDSINITDDMQFLRSNQMYIDTWSNIAVYDLLDFPRVLYAWWEKYTYTASMEPYFLYLQNSGQFFAYIDYFYSYFRKPEHQLQNPHTILQNYHANYLVLLGNYASEQYDYAFFELLKYKIADINANTGFELVANSGYNYIWKVK